MKSRINLLLFFILIISSLKSWAQDLTNEKKFEYSSYLYFRVNKNIYIDNFNLSCFDSRHHVFAFMQNDLTFNYKFTKKAILLIGDAVYLNNWMPAYQYAYNSKINRLGSIVFHRPTVGFKYKFALSKYTELEETFTFQHFVPSLEKYQSRFVFGTKLSYDNEKMPLEFEPFAQMILYYYINGKPFMYFDDVGDYLGYFSPNGLHRYRYRLGFKIKPIKALNKFDIMFYLAGQKEFNLMAFGGHELNTSRKNIPLNTKQTTILPYNTYNIFGFQINYVFDGNASKKKFW